MQCLLVLAGVVWLGFASISGAAATHGQNYRNCLSDLSYGCGDGLLIKGQ